MNILITAGSSMSMLDQVRGLFPVYPDDDSQGIGLGNIFWGTTGREIVEALAPYHRVTLITSGSLKLIDREIRLVTSWQNFSPGNSRVFTFGSDESIYCIRGVNYRTFEDLAELMEQEIRTGEYDVIIHSAAVNDFAIESVWCRTDAGEMVQVDASTKISSSKPELFLKLKPTYKIVDKIKRDWGFKGVLVKFKLQVGMSDEELIEIAKRSRKASDADMMVANCLEWARERAYVINADDEVTNADRSQLPTAIWKVVRSMIPLETEDGKER